MLFEEVLQEERKEGHKEGAEQILHLSEAMVEAGEAGQIQRLRKEPEFLAAMLKKYGLGSAEQ